MVRSSSAARSTWRVAKEVRAACQAAGTNPPKTARLRAANITHGTRSTACMSS